MSEFTRGQEIEAVKPIRLANGITLEVGSRGKVIGMGSHETVAVQFDDYIGAVSVWASLIAVTTQPPATEAAAGAGEGDVRSFPQRYRDERMAAKERGETIKDYTGWLETELASARAQLAVASWLLKSIERNMPQTKKASDDDKQVHGFAHNAWMARQLIREYVAASQPEDGEE